MKINQINQNHVAMQFSRRIKFIESHFLYKEIANRLINRLKYIKFEPIKILDVGCNKCNNFTLLNNKYPNSSYIGLDICKDVIDASIGIIKKENNKKILTNYINKLFFKKNHHIKHELMLSDMSQTKLKEEEIDLIWSNMALHWHNDPILVFKEWKRILKIGGLINFSCFGPNNINELYKIFNSLNKFKTSTMIYKDMHDLGSILIQNGFSDIVMSQESLILTYKNPEDLLRDIHIMGGNPMHDRYKSLISKGFKKSICESLENHRNNYNVIPLTINIIYGHAWKIKRNYNKNSYIKIPINKI